MSSDTFATSSWGASVKDVPGVNGADLAPAVDYLEHSPIYVRFLFALGAVLVLAVLICMMTAGAPGPAAKKEHRSAEALAGDEKVKELEKQRRELAGEVANLSAKIEAARSPPMSDEELRRKACLAAGRAEEALRQRVETVINTVAPAVVRAKRVQAVVKEAVETTKNKAASLATDKGTAIFDLFLRALEVDMSAVEALQYLRGTPPNADDEDNATESLPLSLLLAGLVAPIQLQIVASWNRLQLSLVMALLLLIVGVMSFDIGRPCGTGILWTWTIGLALILSCAVCARLALLSKAVAVLKETRHDNVAAPAVLGEEWILLMRTQMLDQSEEFFHALVGYDQLASSWPSSVLNILNAVQILWGGLGVYWTIANVVADETQCDAGALRFVAHGYSFIYVMLLTWTVPMFALWIVTNLLSSRTVSLEVLRRAKMFDENYSVGVPVATLITRMFLLQSVADIRGAECASLQNEVATLTAEKSEIRAKSLALDAEIEEKEMRYQEMMAEQRKEIEERGAGEAGEAGGEEVPAAGESTQDPAAAARELAIAALQRARDAGLDVDSLVQRARDAQNSTLSRAVGDPLL